jgi:hypothetical protein
MSEEPVKIEEKVTKTVTFSFKQLLVAGSIILSVIGGSFGIGMKTQKGFDDIIQSKKELKYQEEINNLILTKGRELKEAQEDRDFYKGRYIITNTRLKSCIDKSNYVKDNGIEE